MLRVEDLSVSYGSVLALDGVSLEVAERGVLHGIIGPNGAGKSTLMDAITGRRKPTRGRVFVDGEDITDRPVAWRRRRGMSRSFQRTSIFPGFTVREQLELVAAHLGEPDLGEIVDTFELGAVYDKPADSIAYGDQRRVDIALAMIGKPSLMMLDEPAAGLSTAETVALFEHLIKLVRHRGVTALVVEHDVDAVFRFCDAITALDLGRLLITGKPDQVRSDPRVITAYLGTAAARSERSDFLQIKGLTGYGKSVVLRGVDLAVDEGESVAVVGKNGAGKSTLLNSFFGGTTIRAGTIEVGGNALEKLPAYMAPKHGVTISPQGRLILPHLTVQENLLLGAASGRKGHWTLETIYGLFPVLRDRRARMGTELSGGQQQMLAVGRALLGNPRVLLLDEPSEGLAPLLVDELAATFNKIGEAGVGILIVEQHLSLVRRITQRFVVMAKGEIIDRGQTADIDSAQHQAALAF